MSQPRVIINGVEVPAMDLDGQQAITIIITTTDHGSRAVSGSMTAFGPTFDTIKANLIDPVGARLALLDINIIDPCSGTNIFTGSIRGDLVDWCEGQCKCDFTCVERTSYTDFKGCLKNTLIYDNWNGFQQQAHPRMVYCNQLEQDWFESAVLLLGMIAVIVLYILTPIVAVISTIIAVINVVIDGLNAITFGAANIGHIDPDGNPSTSLLDSYETMRDNFISSIIGCGRKHPSPLLREYILNACDKCGGGFKSSILNDPTSDYYNTVLFNAPYEKGTRDDSTGLRSLNLPNYSVFTLLDKVMEVFNADYIISDVGGVPTLLFERHDNLGQGDEPWVDPVAMLAAHLLEDGLCYSWSSDVPPSYVDVGFSVDPTDALGNESKPAYQDIVEWNQPYTTAQSGSSTRQFQFGMPRCRNGVANHGIDVLSGYEVGTVYSPVIADYHSALLLERGVAALPKLLIWDGGDINFGLVKRGYQGAAIFDHATPIYINPAFAENAPYWCNSADCVPNTGYDDDVANGNIYKRFHAIDNPKVTNHRGVTFKFAFQYTAEDINTMNLFAPVMLPFGIGKISQVVINLSAGTIEVTGTA